MRVIHTAKQNALQTKRKQQNKNTTHEMLLGTTPAYRTFSSFLATAKSCQSLLMPLFFFLLYFSLFLSVLFLE